MTISIYYSHYSEWIRFRLFTGDNIGLFVVIFFKLDAVVLIDQMKEINNLKVDKSAGET